MAKMAATVTSPSWPGVSLPNAHKVWKQRPSSPLIGRFVQTRQSWVEGGYGYSDQSGLFWRRAFGERRSLPAGAAVRAWRARHQPAPAGRRAGRGGAALAGVWPTGGG